MDTKTMNNFKGWGTTSIVMLMLLLQSGLSVSGDVQKIAQHFEVVNKHNLVIADFEVRKGPSGDAQAPVLFEFEGNAFEDGKEAFLYRIYSKNNTPFYSAVYGDHLYGNDKKSFRLSASKIKPALEVRYLGSSGWVTQKIHDVQGGLVAEWSLLLTVSELSFDKTETFKFNMLDMSGMNKREGHQITYKGHAGTEGLHQFVHLRGDGRAEGSYWLDDNHRLVRFVDRSSNRWQPTSGEKH